MRGWIIQAALMAAVLCVGCGRGPKSARSKAEDVVVPAAPVVVPASEAQVKSLAGKVDGVDVTLQAVKAAADGALTTSQSVQTNTEVTNAKLDEQADRLKNIDGNVDDLLKLFESMKDMLAAPAAPVPKSSPKPAPAPAAPPKEPDRHTAALGPIQFRGQPINVRDWLARKVDLVEIVGDVDAHLRYHGLTGNFDGLSREQKLQLHSVAHSFGEKSVMRERSVVKSFLPAAPASPAGDCANGNCAIAPQARRETKLRLRGKSR